MLVVEGPKIVARLCVFCVMRCKDELVQKLGFEQRAEPVDVEEAALCASRGDYDPFADPPLWEDVWEEVFGSVANVVDGVEQGKRLVAFTK